MSTLSKPDVDSHTSNTFAKSLIITGTALLAIFILILPIFGFIFLYSPDAWFIIFSMPWLAFLFYFLSFGCYKQNHGMPNPLTTSSMATRVSLCIAFMPYWLIALSMWPHMTLRKELFTNLRELWQSERHMFVMLTIVSLMVLFCIIWRGIKFIKKLQTNFAMPKIPDVPNKKWTYLAWFSIGVTTILYMKMVFHQGLKPTIGMNLRISVFTVLTLISTVFNLWSSCWTEIWGYKFTITFSTSILLMTLLHIIGGCAGPAG